MKQGDAVKGGLQFQPENKSALWSGHARVRREITGYAINYGIDV